MRLALSTVVAILALSTLSAQTPEASFKDQTSHDLFRAARLAVGRGEGSVLTLRSLLFKGRSRVRVENGSMVDGEVEIRVMLPDHYLRIDSSGASHRLTGYAGNRLLSVFVDQGELIKPPDNIQRALLRSERAHLARLLLGSAVYTSPHFWLTFRALGSPPEMVDPRISAETISVSQASRVPQIVEATGENGFFVRLQIDGGRLPVRIEYRAGKDSSMTMTFSDRRPTSGLRLPYRIVTADNRGTVVDEMTFSSIAVNAPLVTSDFEPPGGNR